MFFTVVLRSMCCSQSPKKKVPSVKKERAPKTNQDMPDDFEVSDVSSAEDD